LFVFCSSFCFAYCRYNDLADASILVQFLGEHALEGFVYDVSFEM
jgi:hypothetical protein